MEIVNGEFVMSVKWKICKRCGRKVNEVAVICPYCSCDEFHTTDITIKNNFPEKLKRDFFYTNYNGGNYVFSGVKFSGIAAIIVLALCFLPNSLISFVIWIIAVIALIFIFSRFLRNDNIGENALMAKMKTSTGNNALHWSGLLLAVIVMQKNDSDTQKQRQYHFPFILYLL